MQEPLRTGRVKPVYTSGCITVVYMQGYHPPWYTPPYHTLGTPTLPYPPCTRHGRGAVSVRRALGSVREKGLGGRSPSPPFLLRCQGG